MGCRSWLSSAKTRVSAISGTSLVEFRYLRRFDVEWKREQFEWPIRLTPAQERKRDVVDGGVSSGPSFQHAVVRVPMENGCHRVPIDGLFEPAAAKERIDLNGFSFDSGPNRRIVKQRNSARRS